MIRPFTCLVFLLACGSGLYLYQSKHRVKLLDEQIAQTVKSTDALREQTRMLSAEWTLLNDPERLRQLASQFLTLQTVSPNQFTSLADLDSRLPPPAPPGSVPNAGGVAPSDQMPVPVASDGASRTGEDEGKAADAKIVEASSGAPKDAAPSAQAAASPAAPGAASPAPRLAMATLADPAHSAERKPSVPRIAPAQPHLAGNLPHAPDQRSPDQRSPDQRSVEQRGFDQRTVEQRVAETRSMPLAPRVPAPLPMSPAGPQTSGSLLGMAHGMGSPPVPLPLPRPMPVSAPNWSYTNGG
ncbi:MAG: hypothetical protein ABSC95_14845 [Acetobacteraceae bacterium]|jgi:hypothetical protein